MLLSKRCVFLHIMPKNKQGVFMYYIVSWIIVVAFACLGCAWFLEKTHTYTECMGIGWIVRSAIVAIPAIVAVVYILLW